MAEASPRASLLRTALHTGAGVVLMLACVGPLRTQWTAGDWPAARAADAKPLFLAARAVKLGADPLDPAVLQTLAGQAGMREGGGAGAVRTNDPRRGADKGGAYASMYPVTAAVLLQPLKPDHWADFVARFRKLGFGLLLTGAAAAGAAGARRPGTATLGASLGLATVLCIAPSVSEMVGVGQANVHVAGLTGLSLGLLAMGWTGLFGALAVIGGGLKLLPLGMLAPAAAGRHWRALGVAGIAACGLLLVASSVAPLSYMAADVLESIRYQSAVAPKWVLRDAPRPAFVLFHLRQLPLGAATAALALALLAPHKLRMRRPDRVWWRSFFGRPAPTANVVAAATLTAAWMAVLGAGSQRIYAVLQVPVWAWLAGSVVAPGLRWPGRVVAALLAMVVLLPRSIDATGIAGWDGRAVVLLCAWLAWAAVAGRCVVHGWDDWGWGRRVGALGVLAWLAGLGVWWSRLAPLG